MTLIVLSWGPTHEIILVIIAWIFILIWMALRLIHLVALVYG